MILNSKNQRACVLGRLSIYFGNRRKKQLHITIYIYHHQIQRSASQPLSIFESRCIQLIDAAAFLFAKAREDDRPDLFHNDRRHHHPHHHRQHHRLDHNHHPRSIAFPSVVALIMAIIGSVIAAMFVLVCMDLLAQKFYQMTHDHPANKRHQWKCQICNKNCHGLEIRRIVDKHFPFLPPWNPQTVDLGKTRLRSQRHRLTGNLRLWLSKSVCMCFGGIGRHHDQQQGRCRSDTALENLGWGGQKSS